jgi:hypothetical protein
MMRKITLVTVFVLSLAALTITVVFASAHMSDIYPFPGGPAPGDGAMAVLDRHRNNISFDLHTSGLEGGAAYTIWYVVFNHPGYCLHPAGIEDALCGEGDIFEHDAGGNLVLIVNPDGTFGTPGVEVTVFWAAGHVIGAGGIGNFAGHTQAGRAAKADQIVFGDGMVHDAQEAEIHLVVRNHHQPVGGQVNEQIHTFEGDCAACVDEQFAIFPPPN